MAETFANQLTAVSTDSATAVLAAPAAGVQRVVRYISIYNPNASIDVTLQLDKAATDFIIAKQTLTTDETLEYEGALVLADTDEILEVLLGAVPGSDVLVTAHYMDKS